MNALHERIRSRLAALEKSARKASIDSGLSEYTVATLLKKPEQSQTIETICKLAIGLDTTPEWLAFGVTVKSAGPKDAQPHQAISAEQARAPLYKNPLKDSDSIQVAIGDLRRASLHALHLAKEADASPAALADVLLSTLADRPSAFAVQRLAEFDRSHFGSAMPKLGDQS